MGFATISEVSSWSFGPLRTSRDAGYRHRIIRMLQLMEPNTAAIHSTRVCVFTPRCLCVCPMLPQLAAKVTEGRLTPNDFQPHCNPLQKARRRTQMSQILMHSGIAPGTTSLESCSSFQSAGGMLSTMTVSERRWQWRSGDFVLRRHIVAPRHSICLNNSSLERLSRWRNVSGRSLIRHVPVGVCVPISNFKTRHFHKFAGRHTTSPLNLKASNVFCQRLLECTADCRPSRVKR